MTAPPAFAEGMVVRLRLAQAGDAELFSGWVSLSAVGVLVGGGGADGVSAAGWRAALRDGDTRYAVIETLAGDPVGAVSWHRLAHDRAYDVGGLVGDSGLWSAGYGLEGAMLLVEHLFRSAGAHRVELVTGLFNSHTVPLLVKGGVVVEAVLRDNLFVDGRHHDTVVCSILRAEYDEPLDGYMPRGVTVPPAERAAAAAALAALPRRAPAPVGAP